MSFLLKDGKKPTVELDEQQKRVFAGMYLNVNGARHEYMVSLLFDM